MGMRTVSNLAMWLILILHPVSGDSLSRDEVTALSAFKTAITGDPHGLLDDWNPNLTDACSWFHVTCDKDDNVTRVDLGNCNLTGHLVPELGSLAHLQFLELYGNKFNGKIPPELGNLANLVSLDLYNNALTGPIPDTLGNLANLQFLRLNDNNLSGCEPVKALSKIIPHLHAELDVSNNPLLRSKYDDPSCEGAA